MGYTAHTEAISLLVPVQSYGFQSHSAGTHKICNAYMGLYCIAYCIHGDCRYACFILRSLSIILMNFVVRKRSMLLQCPIGQYKQDQFVLYKSTLIIMIVIMGDTTLANGLCNQQGTQANIIVWLGFKPKIQRTTKQNLIRMKNGTLENDFYVNQIWFLSLSCIYV